MKTHLLAQNVGIGGTSITGPLKDINTIGDVINKILPFVMTMAGIILFFILVLGGIDIMTAQGSPDKVKSGRAKITAGIIGFVLMMLSYLITRLISYIFDIGAGIF